MKILFGVTSSIAIYKSLDIISQLRKKGHEIQVILTKNALKMVSVIPFHSLSANIVAYEEFGEKDYIPHISMTDWADVMVIAPATANIIGKMANGIADDLLSTSFLAFNKKILVAPAMNVKMYSHPLVQKNIQTLKGIGVQFVEPAEGMLACGYEGKGKLAPVDEIVASIENLNSTEPKILKGKKVLVTSGGTVEDIDPVRYITNRSSGRMGFAFAQKAREMGADVTLVYANVSQEPPCCERLIKVRSADEMLRAVSDNIAQADILIMAAAVADFKPAVLSEIKIKKENGDEFHLDLIKNPDILKTIAPSKKRNQIFIGFALETDHLMENAQKKLKAKNLDLIIANSPENFDSKEGNIKVLYPNGKIKEYCNLTKNQIAHEILSRII